MDTSSRSATGGPAEMDFFNQVAARGGSADEKAEEICKDKSKCCDKVTIYLLGSLPNLGIVGQEYGNIFDGTKHTMDKVRTLVCATGKWSYQ